MKIDKMEYGISIFVIFNSLILKLEESKLSSLSHSLCLHCTCIHHSLVFLYATSPSIINLLETGSIFTVYIHSYHVGWLVYAIHIIIYETMVSVSWIRDHEPRSLIHWQDSMYKWIPFSFIYTLIIYLQYVGILCTILVIHTMIE